MENVYIAGIGMTPFGRHLDLSLKHLTSQAVEAALEDGGCNKEAIEAAYFGNAVQGHMEGQHMIRGHIALLDMGISGIPIFNVESACATASMAFHLGVQAIQAGSAEVVLAVGADKMYSTDRVKMFTAFDGGVDVYESEQHFGRLKALGEGVEVPPGTTSDKPYSVAMDAYAGFCRQYMRRFGLTQRQLATVCAKNHQHSVHNPLAQFRDPYTVEQVLAAAPIVYPLTLPMCAPISDGAAAVVLCSASALARLGADLARAVRVRASVTRSTTPRDGEDLEHHITRLAARQAYDQAGLEPEDMDLAEVHDATAMGEIIQSENLGFCNLGEGGHLAESGATRLGGRIPINPSGGLASRGHPVGATGLAQIHELVTQLRGEAGPRQVTGARFAIQENGGGIWGIEEASCHIGVFGRD